MTVLVSITVVLLVISFAIGTLLVFRGKEDATRAVVGDLMFFCAIAIFIVTGIVRGTSVLFDVAMLGTLTGVLATVALARILARGRR